MEDGEISTASYKSWLHLILLSNFFFSFPSSPILHTCFIISHLSSLQYSLDGTVTYAVSKWWVKRQKNILRLAMILGSI